MMPDFPASTPASKRLTGLSRVPIPIWIFVVSVTLSLMTLAVVRPAEFRASDDFSDISSDYGRPAQDIIEGRDYSAFRFPPAVPLSLAALYAVAHASGLSDRALVAVWLVLLVAAGALLLYGILRALWPKTPSVIAIALWLFYPPALYLAGYVGSEQLFNVGLFASVLLLLRAQSMEARRRPVILFASGICAAAAMLARSTGIALIILLPLALLWKPTSKRVGQDIAALLLGMALLVAPWEAYVYSRIQVVVPISLSGAGAMIDGATYAVDPKDHRNVAITDADRALQLDFYSIPRGEITTMGQVLAFFADAFRTRPGAVIEHFATKLVNVWYATDGSRLGSVFLLFQLPYIVLLVVSLALGFRQRALRQRMALLAALFGLSVLGITALSVPLMRYLIPAVGLIWALIPATLEAAGRIIQRQRAARQAASRQ